MKTDYSVGPSAEDGRNPFFIRARVQRKQASQDILKRLKAMGITHLSGKAITANQIAKWREKMMTELASENQAVARYEFALKYVSGLEPVPAVEFLLRFGICPSTIPENPAT